ncbi:proline dehydrogenase family protein [Pseudomonas sp.]|uniref:proline dehydrogenase family protein n=1 Tax=Pseudomonas sp. TaxID=306 RepID=UPI0027226395|nr:proline dehydrogenase family protein [Pseudomonas sp.]MDO8707093.1 proline dehydrogenase family protein [Pseudomonas sp.]
MKGLLSFFAKRYIAGEDRRDAIGVVRRLNTHGILATIDNLGEHVKDLPNAEEAVREYLGLLNEIRDAGVDSTVSLKLSHLGLDISNETAERNAEAVIKRGLELGNSVTFDMEGSRYTQRTMDIFLGLHERYPNTAIAVQSYLYRSASDVQLLIEKGASVRLVKGAYKEPPDIAFPKKRDVDRNFEELMKSLLLKGKNPAIATHDERLINEAIRFAEENRISKERFEFQMLLGIKRGLQWRLAESGYKVRAYVPYGAEWLPYTLRRLRERRENLFFIIKNIFD